LTGPLVHGLRAGTLVALATAAILAPSLPAQQPSVAVTPIDLPVGRSYPITTPVNVIRVSIATPDVADLIVISEREVVINSLKPGETDAILWLADNTRTHYRIAVHSPADRKQIAIAVKFAEVRRDVLREFGLAGLWRDQHHRVGTGIFSSDNAIDPQTGAVSLPGTRFLSVLSDIGTDRVLAFLDAEEQRGNARLLAEPTILAGNNETASFLAGGELPIPVVQGLGAGVGGGAGGGGGITVQFREFGIRLAFTGEIVSDSLIKLNVTPEVSSLDFANAVTIQGFRIPAFRTRRVSSTVDVRRDQSLIISGMFSAEDSRVRTGIPLLKDIPIIGLLFSSSRFQRAESELLVVVTPVVIDPHRPRRQDTLRLSPDTTTPALDAIRRRIRPPQDR
jgi:pilus assembly protein CpaC